MTIAMGTYSRGALLFVVVTLLLDLNHAFVIPFGATKSASISIIQNFHHSKPIKHKHNIVISHGTIQSRHYNFFENLLGGGGDKNDDDQKDEKNQQDNDNKNKDDEKFQDGAYDPEDPVEQLFGFFFGKREEAPMGMARFGPERFPEQYPATTTEWAEPVSSDNALMATIRPVLKNTNLETRGLRCTYNANAHGWDPTAFHKRVDKQGPGLVVCKTVDGLLCGGYSPKGWVGYGESRSSIAAFLFIQKEKDSNSFIKLRKVGGPGLAQQDFPESGPSFGPDALVIPLNAANPKAARSKLGSYYERFEDGTDTLFDAKTRSTRLKELYVFHGVWGKDEYIPFTDAEPFALY